MTTIILTIIGILLAAAAALMVIFYGGDAFNGGSIGARANTLQNAGTNVLSAVQLYKGERGATPTSVADLTPNYLKEVPALGGVTAATPTFDGVQFAVTGVALDVCEKVNTNMGRAAQETSEAGKMGCAYNATTPANNKFFSNI